MRTLLLTCALVLLPYGLKAADTAVVYRSLLMDVDTVMNADSVTDELRPSWRMVGVYTPMGDMNGDDKVTLADIIYMVNWILKDQEPPVLAPRPDIMQAVLGDTVVFLSKPYVKDEKQ